MSLAEELERLAALHEKGLLSFDEFQQAKARLISPSPVSMGDNVVVDTVSRLRLSRDDRWIGGVCGGLARLTDMASWIWRLIFAALFLFAGTGILLYILLWIFVPDE
jgi:phage shock protein PspC (stress-responsive transcriptional regulator)